MRDYILLGLHIAFAPFLLLITLLEHGPAILTADAAAALGFWVFFVLGLPALAIAIGTVFVSIVAGKWWLKVLAAGLLATFVCAVINLWTGIFASFGYFSFAVWALVQRRINRETFDPVDGDWESGPQWVKNALLLLAVLAAAGLLTALFFVGV